MKSFRNLAAVLAVACMAAACAVSLPSSGSPPTPAQQAIAASITSYTALDTAIVSADAAVKAGVLKGQDARNALMGLTDAKTGLDLALVTLRAANAAASAASGVPK